MKSTLKILVLLFIVTGLLQEINAIPAFARKYKMSCMTCHSPIPRLKAYGNDFAGNGFRLADKESPRYFVETGDEELSLIRNFPIAVRIDAHMNYNNNNEGKIDFESPYLLKLLSGGTISKRLSYYFYFYFNERGSVVGVEDAYLHYNNAFNTEFDIAVGQFSVSDPLFKSELRLTLEDYVIYKQKVGNSKARLSYDRGFMFTYSLNFGMDMAFEVVNGNGLDEADAEKIFDSDNCKNFAYRISQSIGDIVRVGAFGYYGNEILDYYNEGTFKNTMYYFGPDLTLSFGDIVEFNVQYLYRNDSELMRGSDMEQLQEANDTTSYSNITTQGGFAELIFTPKGDKSKWYLVVLGNWVDSDFNDIDYKAATLHAGYIIRRNIRLVGEVTCDFSDPKETYGKGSVGIVAAF